MLQARQAPSLAPTTSLLTGALTRWVVGLRSSIFEFFTEAMSNLLKRSKDTTPSAKSNRRKVSEGPTGQAHATLCRVAAVSLAQLLRPMAASGVPQPPAARVAAVTAALRQLPCLAEEDTSPSAAAAAAAKLKVDVEVELRRSVEVLQLTDRAAALAAHASTTGGGGDVLHSTGKEAEAEAEEHEEGAAEVRDRSSSLSCIGPPWLTN